MGIIKASIDAVKRAAADQWEEMIKAEDLSEGVIASIGRRYRDNAKMTNNTKGTPDVISDGSVIIVPENTCMLLVSNGKVVDFTTEAGQYIVDNKAAPSIFTGNLGESLKNIVKDTWDRVRFGGTTPQEQKVVYISMKEINDIKYGTPSPIPYYDANYDVDLEAKAFGSYSVKILDPLKFFMNVLATDARTYTIDNFNEQYRNEFLQEFSVALSRLSAQNIRISQLMMYGKELSDQMSTQLDEKWMDLRGMEILSVAVVSITYSDKSSEILEIRNKGAILTNPNIREGYFQGSIARGIEAAGSNQGGSTNPFIGIGMGMNAAGNVVGQMSQTNLQQMQMEQESKARQNSQESPSSNSWTCPECNTQNTGNFCQNCGTKKPEQTSAGFCSECGYKFNDKKPKFCPNCGHKVE